VTELHSEEVSYGGWSRCLRLSTSEIQLLLTLDVGPRILHCQRLGGPNLFFEDRLQLGGRDELVFQLRGGHRFWTAPESAQTYEADNTPVEAIRHDASSVLITSPARYGLRKSLQIRALAPSVVQVRHGLRNVSESPIERAAWALTVMAKGGIALLPQPQLSQHPSVLPSGTSWRDEDLLPSRRLVLWPYTDLGDPRLRLCGRLWTVEQRAGMPPLKLGMSGVGGVAAYQLGSSVFVKNLPVEEVATYPDLGASFELFTDGNFLELETLGPLRLLPPGQQTWHDEHWLLGHSAADLRDEPAGLAYLLDAAAVLHQAATSASAPHLR